MVFARPVPEKKSLCGKRAVGSYKLGKKLGEGVVGAVHVAVDDRNNRLAAKVIKGDDAATVARVQHEADMLAQCEHPGVIRLHDFLRTDKGLYLVTDLADADLFTGVLQQNKSLFDFNEDGVKSAMFQLLSAVAHLHSRNIAHRDLKPENILLLKEGGRVVLCDFGHAVQWKEGDAPLSEAAGTVRSLPPEMFVVADGAGGREYNPRALDMWACGVVMFFMLTKRFPFDEANDLATATAIVSGKFTHSLPSAISGGARDLLGKLLVLDPASRPSAGSLLHHPFLHSARQQSM